MVPTLQDIDMCITDDKKDCFIEPYNLANIADFNSLIAQSQEHKVPVFLLTQAQVGKVGNVWENMKKNRDAFYSTFDTLADKIVKITS